MIIVEPIINATADAYQIGATELIGRSRIHPVAEARMVAMHLVLKHTHTGMHYTAARFGRSRGSADYADKTIRKLLTIDKKLKQKIKKIESVVIAKFKNEL